VDRYKCRDPQTGKIEAWARDIIKRLNSYTEVSPSGRGLHIIIKGKLPPGGNRKGNIEIYSHGRYFTMTGHHIEGAPTSIESRQTKLEALHREIFGKPKEPPQDMGPRPTLDLSDQELLDKALASNDENFAKIWRGDICDYDNDDSKADFNLCLKLAFWTRKDAARIDRLFRQSGLMRDKWNRRTGTSTYGAITIDKAISQTTEVYTPGGGADPNRDNGNGQAKDKKRPSLEKDSPIISDAELLNFAKTGQVGDAGLFIRLLKGQFCFDHAGGRWYQWGGHYWIEDDLNNVLIALDQVSDAYEEQARKCAWKRARATREDNETQAKQAQAEEDIFLKKILKLQKIDWRRDVLHLAAAGEGSLGISGKEWDKNLFLIACPNGVLELDTGDFREGRPEDFIKTICPTEWRGSIEPAPQWEIFLKETFDNDQELIAYLQRLMGYALSGQRVERILSISWGAGWNGKGTLFETFEHTLGELAGPVPAEILLEEGKHHHKSGGAPDLPPAVVPSFKLGWGSSQARDPGGA